MEFLNKDLLSELSKYLLYYDLRNLKLAFPDLDLSEDLYEETKEETYKILRGYWGFCVDSIIDKMFHSEYRDYLFKNIHILRNTYREVYVDIDCHILKDIVTLSPIKSINDQERFDKSYYLQEDKFYEIKIRNYKHVRRELSKILEVKLTEPSDLFIFILPMTAPILFMLCLYYTCK